MSSVCSGMKEIILEVNLKDEHKVNYDWHPTKINLFLWDNLYTLTYEAPAKELDKNDLMIAKEYSNVVLEGTMERKKKIKADETNWIGLDPQKLRSFNKYTIGKLFDNSKGIHECKLKFFKAYFPGNEQEYWDNLFIEPIYGYQYKKTEKRFVDYFGKTYEVFENDKN